MKRFAIVMAGGSGERFWPVSHGTRPKQLLRLASPDATLLEESVARLDGLIEPDRVVIATAPHLVEPIRALRTGVPRDNVLAEPHKRNTTGALAWATAALLARDADLERTATIAVLAADHRIDPPEAFRRTIASALDCAERTGGLVTVGIRPDRPETGYGYIERGDEVGPGAFRVRRFTEKPDREAAEEYVSGGSHFWNSGMFFWTVATFLAELARAAPEIERATRDLAELLRAGREDDAAAVFAGLPNVSIDYCLMEKASDVYVVEAEFEWDDLGSWDALSRARTLDEHGNVSEGAVVLVDCENSVAFNDSLEVSLNLLGVRDIVVVCSGRHVMVCHRDRAQDVRRLVEAHRAAAGGV